MVLTMGVGPLSLTPKKSHSKLKKMLQVDNHGAQEELDMLEVQTSGEWYRNTYPDASDEDFEAWYDRNETLFDLIGEIIALQVAFLILRNTSETCQSLGDALLDMIRVKQSDIDNLTIMEGIHTIQINPKFWNYS